MLDLKFHPDVVSEIRSSYLWYQSQTEGLGEDLLSELESAYEAILQLPETWPLFQKGFNKVSSFPVSFFSNLS